MKVKYEDTPGAKAWSAMVLHGRWLRAYQERRARLAEREAAKDAAKKEARRGTA